MCQHRLHHGWGTNKCHFLNVILACQAIFFSLITFSSKFYSEQFLEVIPVDFPNEKPIFFGRIKYFLCRKRQSEERGITAFMFWVLKPALCQAKSLYPSAHSLPLFIPKTNMNIQTFWKFKVLLLIMANIFSLQNLSTNICFYILMSFSTHGHTVYLC